MRQIIEAAENDDQVGLQNLMEEVDTRATHIKQEMARREIEVANLPDPELVVNRVQGAESRTQSKNNRTLSFN